jgi:hypothetical protein
MHDREREHFQAEQSRVRMDDTGVQALECYRRWMERTSWPKTYRGVRRDILLSLSLPDPPHAFPYAAPTVLSRGEDDAELTSPRSHERKIAKIMTAVDIMIDRCKESVNHAGRPILCWLRTVNPPTVLSETFPANVHPRTPKHTHERKKVKVLRASTDHTRH